MKQELRPAIEALETELRDLEGLVIETKKMINRLYELSGAPPIYGDLSLPEHRSAGVIRADQFYGKVLTTAAREYLDMRKLANRGPASPREIYEALVEGGFKFEARNDDNAITGLRQTLRKNSSIFHRLPNGQYGLLAWYPNAKQTKANGVDDDASAKPATRKTTSGKRRKRKKQADAGVKQGSDDVPITDRVLEVMGNGADWTLDLLKQEIPSVGGRRLQGSLISLKGRNLVQNVERGVWRIVAGDFADAESPGESEAAADIPSAAA